MKKAMRLVLRAFGLLCLLLVLAVLGAGIWLRTDQAGRVVLGVASDILKDQGLYLTAVDVRGPLPERLYISGVSLADEKGEFFRLENAEVEVDLAALFSAVLKVRSVAVSGPELLRLPVLPPAAPEPEATEASASAVSLVLPLTVELGALRVERARLPGGLDSLQSAAPAVALTPEREKGPEGEQDASPASPLANFGEKSLNLDATLAAKLQAGVLSGQLELNLRAEDETGPPLGLFASVEDLKAVADGGEANTLTASGRLRLSVDSNDWPLEYGVRAEQREDSMRLSGLELRGIGLAVTGSASYAGATEQVDGALVLDGKEDAARTRLLVDVFGLPGDLVAALGPELELKAGLSGNKAQGYAVALENLRAGGVWAKGGARYSPAREVDAAFSLGVGDLAPFAPQFAGPVDLAVTAKGPVPDDLTAGINLTSPALQTPAGHLQEIACSLSARMLRAADGALSARGNIQADIRQAPGGEARVSGAWRAVLDPGGAPVAAAVEDMTLHGFGTDVEAGLTASFGQPSSGSASQSGQGGGETPFSGLFPHDLALDGTLTARVRTWEPLSALAGDTLSGQGARAEITLEHRQGSQNARADLVLDSLAMRNADVALQGITASLKAENLAGDPLAELRLQAGPGKAGGIAWTSARASLDGGGRNGGFSASVLGKETASAGGRGKAGKGRQKPSPGTAAKGHSELLALEGSYELASRQVTIKTLTVLEPAGKVGLRLQRPATVSLADGIALNDLDAAFIPGGSLKADAEFKPGHMRARAFLAGFPLSALSAVAGASVPGGILDAEVDCATSPTGPRGIARAELRLERESAMPLNADGKAASDISVDARLEPVSGSRMRLAGSGSILAGSVLGGGLRPAAGSDARGVTGGSLEFSVPLQLNDSGIPLPDNGGPLSAALRWNGPVDPLWRLAPMQGRRFSGAASVDIVVSGSMEAPKLAGHAYLAGGRYEDTLAGLLLTDMDLAAEISQSGVVHAVLALKDGKAGSAGLEGTYTPGKEASLALRGQIRHLEPLHRDDLTLTLSGLMGVNGPLAAPKVTADILVEKGEFTIIPSSLGGSVPTLDLSEAAKEEQASSGGPECSLHIAIPQRFFIRGMGMDSEWEGDLRITGLLAEPSIAGSLAPVRGYFSFLSKPFAFTGGDIEFAGGSRINPALSLELTYKGPQLEAIIKAGGTAQKPVLSMESKPPLPQDEVLAQVLFGKRVSELSRFEAIQLASSLRDLKTGSGAFDPIATARKATGLDVLRLGGSQGKEVRQTSGLSGTSAAPVPGQSGSDPDNDLSDGPSMEAGKYISDRIYVGVQQGATPESTAVRMEVELSPSLSLEGSTTSNSSQGGLLWKWDY